MKLGLGENAIGFAITGRLGHLIRKGTYLELLPTPLHFKVTAEWLTDELFHNYTILLLSESNLRDLAVD